MVDVAPSLVRRPLRSSPPSIPSLVDTNEPPGHHQQQQQQQQRARAVSSAAGTTTIDRTDVPGSPPPRLVPEARSPDVASRSSPTGGSFARKRTASTDSGELAEEDDEDDDHSRPSICLCTPAPKIRRPRNAFILYRTAHQAGLLKEMPKISNPDVSKVLGERWRNESESEKNKWKRLAEDEKAKHQKEHPDYRYRPRRKNRGSGSGGAVTSPGSSVGGGGAAAVADSCSKCGGRFLATPGTPGPLSYRRRSSPETVVGSRRPSVAVPDANMNGVAAQSRGVRDGPQVQQQQQQHHHGEPPFVAGSPDPRGYKRARLNYDGVRGDLGAHSYPPVAWGHHEPPGDPSTPRSARALGPGPVHWAPMPQQALLPPPPPQQQQQQQSPMMYREQMARGHRLSVVSLAHASPSTDRSVDAHFEQLRLPPLQTQTVGLPVRSGLGEGSHATTPRAQQHHPHHMSQYQTQQPRTPSQAHAPPHPQPRPHNEHIGVAAQARPPPPQQQQQQLHRALHPAGPQQPAGPEFARISRREDEARSVRAMVMEISHWTKLESLREICPPLGPPSPDSPGAAQVETRGPIIAVEGPFADVRRVLGEIVRQELATLGGFTVRVWRGGKPAVDADRLGEDKSWWVVGGDPHDRERKVVATEHGDAEDVDMGDAPTVGDKQRRQSGGDKKAVDEGGHVGASKTAAATPDTGRAARTATILVNQAHREYSLGSYRATILEWDAKSAEMVKFVTTKPAPHHARSSPASSPSPSHTGSPAAPAPAAPAAAATSSTPATATASTAATSSTPATATASTAAADLVPVALLPDGFSLTLSDVYACAVPIRDQFSPERHWNWMAMMWRGVVGPDLVVLVRRVVDKAVGVNGWSVDLTSPRTLRVRVSGTVDARALLLDQTFRRRLGFELREWMALGSFRAGYGLDAGERA